MLILQCFLGESIESHFTVVICAGHAVEEAMRDGEKWHMLDVRIVLGGVGDYVVNVMVLLPPTARESTEEICNEDADYRVNMKRVGDAHVAGVVDREDQLVPEHAEKDGRERVPAGSEEVERGQCEEGVARDLDGVGSVIAIIKTFSTKTLVEEFVLFDDSLLSLRIE